MLSPDSTAAGDAGTTVTHTMQITNTGNTSDTFTLMASSVWTTTMSTYTVTLPAAGDMMVSVYVEIPPGAMGQDVATITAVSISDPAATATTNLTTRLDQIYIYLPLIVQGN